MIRNDPKADRNSDVIWKPFDATQTKPKTERNGELKTDEPATNEGTY